MNFRFFSSLAAGLVVLVWVVAAQAADPPAEGTHNADGHGHHVTIGAKGVSEDPAELRTDLAIYSFLVFLGLMGLLYRFAWGPITEGLERRERSVHDNISAAEAARVRAEKLLAQHQLKLEKVQDEVRAILAEARRDAEHTKSEIVAVAQKEGEATRKRAVQDIERARDQALDDLFERMAKSVEEATEKVLGRAITGPDHERLIEEALAGVARK